MRLPLDERCDAVELQQVECAEDQAVAPLNAGVKEANGLRRAL